MLPRMNAVAAALMVLLYVAWWIDAEMPRLGLVMLGAAVLPLLLTLPALWQARRIGTTVAGFVVAFHLAYAMMELFANPEVRGWVAAQTFLALLLFTGTMVVLRSGSAKG
ncbi:MAG: DUF2069 domain-containing protein [Gammaproteobacteria bacterium]|nr:DUF2069 domain-containing protein [Gammaproteobacteria bacterium]